MKDLRKTHTIHPNDERILAHLSAITPVMKHFGSSDFWNRCLQQPEKRWSHFAKGMDAIKASLPNGVPSVEFWARYIAPMFWSNHDALDRLKEGITKSATPIPVAAVRASPTQDADDVFTNF